MDGNVAFTYRRALEALRSGVPNREAVKILGCHQPQAENQFTALLRQCADQKNPPPGSLGMLVSGGFGAGKSHLLSYLEHQALSQGFACSRVAVSKETPLYDLSKVFKSAIDHGRLPDRSGQLMEELGLGLRENSEPCARLLKWAGSEPNGLHRMFPATLAVHEKAGDPELISDVRAFWSGGKLSVSTVKKGLSRKGYKVDHVIAYRTVAPGKATDSEADQDIKHQIAQADAVTFTSPSAATRFVNRFGLELVPPIVVCIGPRTAKRCDSLNVPVAAVADPHSEPGLIAALQRALGTAGQDASPPDQDRATP